VDRQYTETITISIIYVHAIIIICTLVLYNIKNIIAGFSWIKNVVSLKKSSNKKNVVSLEEYKKSKNI